MSTIDIPRCYHHYHLLVAITHVLSNVTQTIDIRESRKRKEISQEKSMYIEKMYITIRD